MGNDIGVIILGTAVLVLMGWGLRGFFTDAEIHLGLRVAVGVIGGGILFLVVRLVKARLTKTKTEKPRGAEK